MHIQRHARGLQYICVFARFRFLPALRIAEEELHRVGAVGLGGGQRIFSVDMRTNEHATESRPAVRHLVQGGNSW
jgi:hypothetical protein